ALVAIPGFEKPVVVDLLRVESARTHRYDLPLHFKGQLLQLGPAFETYTTNRPVLGDGFGYQHVWVDATARQQDQPFVTWQTGNRFHTWHWAPVSGSTIVIGESGANDPRFNLRREPLLIQRVKDASNALFAGVLEGHGLYDPASERVTGSSSQIASLRAGTVDDADVMIVKTKTGSRVAIAVAHSMNPSLSHRVRFDGETLNWTGPVARIILR
ncbi:MAG: alginate lyase, partial [Pseudomonadales bacterium]|nr:alginate lyase [Pseudomonadales bacterium]